MKSRYSPVLGVCVIATLFPPGGGRSEGRVTTEIQSTSSTGWERMTPTDGTVTFRLGSWSRYFDLLETEVFRTSAPKHRYIWRGQRNPAWTLSSSLDRLFERLHLLPAGASALERQSAEHLDAFKYAARGRRGHNPAELSENDWWALGQHFGLATPLLDWTRSPFAAAYLPLKNFRRTTRAIELCTA